MKSQRFAFRLFASLLAFPFLASIAFAAGPSITVLATFDYPGGGNQTEPQKINDLGDIAGRYVDAFGVTRGFIRFHNGTFSAPIVEPFDTGNLTDVRGINNGRTVCGYYSNAADNTEHGFFFNQHSFTGADVPLAFDTFLTTVNNNGDFGGSYIAPTQNQAFVSIGGVISEFGIPGATMTTAHSLNDLNQTVGLYTGVDSLAHGFFRDASGALTFPIDVPGATQTFLFGNNNRGWRVGRYLDGAGTHGVFFQTPTRFVVFDFPGATFTSLNGINQQGLICGRYIDGEGNEHGILARVR